MLAFAIEDQCGQREIIEPIHATRDDLGLESEALGRAQQVVFAEAAVVEARLMANLCGIGRDAVQAGEQYQCGEPSLAGRRCVRNIFHMLSHEAVRSMTSGRNA